MEISQIDKTKAVVTVKAKESVRSAKIEDSISISCEASKMIQWVEKLKQMPDIRYEKLELAKQSNPSDMELAKKFLDCSI